MNSTANLAYDDHRYLKYDTSVGNTLAAYVQASCSDDRGGDMPTLVGEFSLSPATALQDESDFAATAATVAWYAKWFEAQLRAYEKQLGWVFWSWKVELNDWRWDYRRMQTISIRSSVLISWLKKFVCIAAVAAGVIPRNLDLTAATNPCS